MQCTHCATPVPDDARFCQSCGSQVSDAEGQANATAAMDGAAFAHLETLLRDDTRGEFEVERMLGRGGMAVVYLATEVHLSRKVALKILPPELTFGHGVERFKREARTAAALDHPNIIPIYRVASGGKIFWYAMKFLEGRALDEILKERTKFELDETLLILGQVADALDYAHEHRVVHRDIKPANVMLDNRDRVVVTDFGIAKALTEGTLTASGSVIGTPYYMSPEQGLGKPVTGAADQYSVAVMAFRMLAGEVPFEGDSAIDILHKHCMMQPPPLQEKRPDLPAHVHRAVHRALHKEPEKRFPTVGAFVEALGNPGAASARMSESDMATMVLSAQELTNPPGMVPSSAAPAAAVSGAMTAPPAPRRRWVPIVAAVVALGGGVAGWQLLGGDDAVTPPPVEAPATTTAAPEAVAPPPTTGVVQLANLPANPTITTDGVRQAGPVFALPAGPFQLRIEAPSYDPWTHRGTVTAGDTLPLVYAGRRTPPPATTAERPRQTPPPTQPRTPAAAPSPVQLQVGTRPTGTVFVDGVELPAARLAETEVLPGQHQISVVFQDGSRKDTTVTVVAGTPLRVIVVKD